MLRNSRITFKSLILLSLSLPAAAFADVVETRIHDIEMPEKAGKPAQILSTIDGRVYFVDTTRTDIVAGLLSAQAKKAPVSLTLDSKERVVGVSELSAEAAAEYSDAFSAAPTVADELFTDDSDSYTPSTLSSKSEAQRIFDTFRELSFKSECFQRAHNWSYDMYTSYGVRSMKNFLFFTSKFRARGYKWWFHVAPMVYVNDSTDSSLVDPYESRRRSAAAIEKDRSLGLGNQVMMDAEFGISGPRTVQAWTDHFMMDPNFVKRPIPNHPICKEIKKYSEYANNQQSSLCYTLPMPMYYYTPADAENLEDYGTRLDYFESSRLKAMRKCQYKRFWKC
jgi:hypothetical protein